MSTYISTYTTKKTFKATAVEFPATVILRDPSIMPGARSGSIRQLFAWGIHRMTVTNDKRSWFAEVTRGDKGQPVIK